MCGLWWPTVKGHAFGEARSHLTIQAAPRVRPELLFHQHAENAQKEGEGMGGRLHLIYKLYERAVE